MSDQIYSKAYIMHLEADLSSKLIENEILKRENKRLKERIESLKNVNKELYKETKEIKDKIIDILDEY